MIDISKKTKGDELWAIDIIGPETTFAPKQVFFDSPESVGSTKLAYIIEDERKICYPAKVLFDNKQEAELCGAIAFVKAHNSGDLGFDILPDNKKRILTLAMGIIDNYEIENPDKFLYHWMADASDQ